MFHDEFDTVAPDHVPLNRHGTASNHDEANAQPTDDPGRRRRRPASRGAADHLSHFSFLHLENWKNFSKIEVNLQQRVFLIGPNASGKSNLLDVFRFLSDIVAVGGGFQSAVLRRGGVSRLRSLSARRYPDLAILVRLGSAESPDAWEYELRFTQDNRRRPIIQKERVVKHGHEVLLRPDPQDQDDAERLTQTYLEQVHANRAFREVAEFFSSVRYFHVVPQLVREPDRSVGRQDDPYGGDFLEQLARTPEPTRNSRLKRIRRALQIAVPQLQELELDRDERGTPHLRGRYEHWRASGAWLREDQFSDGTLRLMGLLWSVLDGSGPLLLEEPELSLHPGVVRYIPEMMAKAQLRSSRQILLSTQSPELLLDEGIGLDEVLLLQPEHEGTVIEVAASIDEVKALLAGGLTLAEAVIPRTQPKNAQQLLLFGT